MMPPSTKANKWSAKLIIVFQLTTWSTVGTILFQRGAISLYGKAETQNGTADRQERFTRWNENQSVQQSTIKEILRGSVDQNIAARRRNIAHDNLEDATQNVQWPHGRMYSSYRTGNIGRRIPVESSIIRKRVTVERKQDTRGIRAIQALTTIRTTDKHVEEKLNHKENAIVALPSNENPFDTRETVAIDDKTSSFLLRSRNSGSTDRVSLDEKIFSENKERGVLSDKAAEHVKTDTKSQRSPVTRIGAAVAIVMLAIGVVMLLLGPLIVILRAIGDRRRTRQMLLKSRCHDDQPPTYEEAILMDEAPRYSTLELDTILESALSL